MKPQLDAWQFAVTSPQPQTRKIRLLEQNTPLTYAQVLQYCQHEAAFRDFYISGLRAVPFAAYFWEHPPITAATTAQPYEFVVVESSQLAHVAADPSSFSRKFSATAPDQPVIQFENLSGDATLVVPCPRVELQAYPHLAAFVRQAPHNQIHELFVLTAQTVQRQLSARPLWLNTSGLGVYWLHIRLDQHPKYYSHAAYRQLADTR